MGLLQEVHRGRHTVKVQVAHIPPHYCGISVFLEEITLQIKPTLTLYRLAVLKGEHQDPLQSLLKHRLLGVGHRQVTLLGPTA